MTSSPPARDPYAAPPPPPGSRAGPRRWTTIDLVIGFCSVALVCSLFLPWFTGTIKLGSASLIGPGTARTASGSISGVRAHGFLWLVFVLALAVLVVLVARDALARSAARLPSFQQSLIGITGLSFILVLIALIAKPSSGASASLASLGISVSVGWSYGAFVALIAAAVALAAAILTARAGPAS